MLKLNKKLIHLVMMSLCALIVTGCTTSPTTNVSEPIYMSIKSKLTRGDVATIVTHNTKADKLVK